ncbi:hypothetical protein A0J48_023725 [Sphaerospermopsis aphanizomenoides BCCUSP55]|uniref:hypothetical protein n=1 Tax=Sphaerospermopsis aphanizomenoides TaxID=459663 RepID=UPI001905E2A3|nr:hypothetical protein [Sphaerospermopsis aphanizomenoides]MBK1990499.1 hypothetical protein [Sphaerospermopsis aphanizomenoides BCCUSP55]
MTLCVPRCTYFPLLPLFIEPIREIEQEHFANQPELTQQEQLKYLVLKAGIHCELEWIDWCNEALETFKQLQ